MKKIYYACVLLGAMTLPGTMLAQGGIGVAGHVGTLGVGVDVAINATPNIGLRAGANIMPLEIMTPVDFHFDCERLGVRCLHIYTRGKCQC